MARKQRQFTAQLKFETVLETLRGEKPIAQIYRIRQRQLTDSFDLSPENSPTEVKYFRST
jgi:hypothetical protein